LCREHFGDLPGGLVPPGVFAYVALLVVPLVCQEARGR